MSDTFAEIRGSTTCAICDHKRRCKKNADGSKWVCFRKSRARVNGHTRVELTNGVATYIPDALHAKQEAERQAKADAKAKKTSKSVTPPPPAKGKAHTTRDAAIASAEKSTGGKLAGVWDYSDSFAVARFDTDDGKEFRPLCRDKSGWKVKDPPGPLPLYRAASCRAGAIIYLTEGEKCCDAACEIGLTAITSAHGAKSAAKTDWKPLDGVAEIIVLPDNDDAGGEYVVAICKALAEQLDNPPTVRVVKLPGLPAKGDVVEFIEARDSQSPEEIAAEIQALSEKAEAVHPGGGPVLVSLDSVEEKPIHWHWENRLQRGAINMLAADPGLGKSFVALDIAARTTTGTPWPDRRDESIPSGNVIVLAAEDSLADAIKPRFRAAGGDPSKLRVLKAVKREFGARESRFNLQTDLGHLRQAVRTVGDVQLVIIDPITSYLGDIDGNNNVEVREILDPLKDLAEENDITLLLIKHMNKNSKQGKALYRVAGSNAFVEISRVVWLITRDREDPKRRLMTVVKMNNAPEADGLAYVINDAGNGPAVAWEVGNIAMRADEALAAEEQTQNSGGGSKLKGAIKFVEDTLASGPMRAGELLRGAVDANITESTLRRAKDAAGVVAQKQKGDPQSPWFVSIPTIPTRRLYDLNEHLGQVGQVGGQDAQDAQGVHRVEDERLDSGNGQLDLIEGGDDRNRAGNQWVDRA